MKQQEQSNTRDEELASFHIAIYGRARELQCQRTGLLSNSDSIRIATFEHFAAGLLAVKNAVEHARLLGGESREEQIQSMKDYANLASLYSSKEATLVVQEMLEKFTSTTTEKVQAGGESHEEESAAATAAADHEREECCAP